MPDLDILLPALALALGLGMLAYNSTGHRATTINARSQRILWGLLALIAAVLLIARFFQD